MDLLQSVFANIRNKAEEISRSQPRQLQTGLNRLAGDTNPQKAGAQNMITDTARNVGAQIEGGIASIPYAMRNNQRNIRASRGVPVNYNDPNMRRQYESEERLYHNASPINRLGIDSFMFSPAKPPTANSSAQPSPFIFNTTPAPRSDPGLEAMKQEILNESNVRPQAREFLSKIPVAYEDLSARNAAGVAYNHPSFKNPYIGISKDFLEPPDRLEEGADPITPEQEKQFREEQTERLKTVIEHELLHQAPRLIPTDTYFPENLKQVDHYTKRWGKRYMKRPKALVEEMFAEQDLPPAYYWHIYKNTVQKPSTQGFVTDMVHYFTQSQGRHGADRHE